MAKVGGAYVTRAELESALQNTDSAFAKYASTPFGRKNVLDALIKERLAEQDIAEQKIIETPEYKETVERALAALRRAELYRIWLKKLQADGLINVTEEEIAAYHKKYPYEMTLRQIILSNAEDASAVLRALKANKNRFKELSRQYNSYPGSDTPHTYMPGEYFSDVETVAANTASGTVQGFIKTPHGFHILIKDSEKRLSLAQARERVKLVLEQQKLDDYFNSLTQKHKVEVYEEHE